MRRQTVRRTPGHSLATDESPGRGGGAGHHTSSHHHHPRLTVAHHSDRLIGSEAALRRYLAGKISPQALHVLGTLEPNLPRATLVWTPGHGILQFTFPSAASGRRSTSRVLDPQEEEEAQLLATPVHPTDFLAFYREYRREYPQPHKTLTREEPPAWRQLQTNIYT
ncbi:hypothetical protein HPB47_024447 [Ixodes persulcatus]|uniref:Uncharacterized protein n=1 Tax=Ixodes persulcatus TaxID=34615 RepID=A0AC60Q481_IXOPE|nr:hypothetical protein HPB47_024447 [Ixodes persulcatus]